MSKQLQDALDYVSRVEDTEACPNYAFLYGYLAGAVTRYLREQNDV